jgi:hypothetical protein
MPRFTTTILQAGKTATGIEVPPEVIESLASGKRPAVKVTLNGYTYRSTVAPMGGKFMVGVSADVREAAGVAGGDTVQVTLDLDTEPRVVEVPADLQRALARSPKARKAFEALSYSNRKAHVTSIEGAKTDETRQRRIDKTIAKLLEA